MILTDSDIKKAIQEGSVVVESNREVIIAPSCMKFRLSSNVYQIDDHASTVDVKKKNTYPTLKLINPSKNGGLLIRKGSVYLASTKEKIAIEPNLAGMIDGTTNLARLGLSVCLSSHISAGFGHTKPGVITIEITSQAVNEILIHPNMVICNIILFKTLGRATNFYGSEAWNHSGEDGVIGSLLYKQFITT